MQNEIWKEVPFNTRYLISNLGRVKTIDSIIKRNNKNRVKSNYKIKGKFLKARLNLSGYLQVQIKNKENNKFKEYRIHRLVMMVFVGEKKLDVNHKNGIKTDNRLVNLEYCTRSENILHAYENSLNPNFGEKCSLNIHKKYKIYRINFFILYTNMMIKEIAKNCQVSTTQIHHIKNKKSWKHLKLI